MQDRSRFFTIALTSALAILVIIWAEFASEKLALDVLAILLLVVAIVTAIGGYRQRPETTIPQSLQSQSERRQFFDTLSKSISVPFMILSPSGRVAFMSDAMNALFPQLNLGDHYSRLARSSHFVDAVRARLNGEAVEPFLFETHRETDRVFLAVLSAIDAGELSGSRGEVLVEIFDRTKERRGDVMRRDFIANASHELRTPLAAISGGLETIAADNAPETVEHFLPIMQKEAGRMHRLIDDLMSLSKVEMNEHYRPEAEVNLRVILEESLASLRARGVLDGVTITNNYEVDDVVRGDRDQLQQIITNILDNAVNYSGDAPVIEIDRMSEDPRYPRQVGMRIKDNGPGIENRHISRLTERFYRVSTAESRDKGGTGLGLAIVKHMLRRHRGQLEVQSRVGVGSAFTIWLPL